MIRRCDPISKRRAKYILVISLIILVSSFSSMTQALVSSGDQIDTFPETMERTYSFPEPAIVHEGDGIRIIMEGTESSCDPGRPSLPMITSQLLIPPGHQVDGIEVRASEARHLVGKFDVRPMGMPYPLMPNVEPPHEWSDPQVYSSMEWYPRQLHESNGIQWFRGFQISVVNLYPVQYQPMRGKVVWYEQLDVIVHTSATDEASTLMRGLEKDLAAAAEKIDNPELLHTYRSLINGCRGSSLTPTSQSLVNPAYNYDYLLITNSLMNQSGGGDYDFADLLASKNPRGVNTTVVLVEDITSCPSYWNTTNPSFNDTAAQIRAFIRDAYLNWGIEYVLLGGDGDGTDVGGESGDEIIPARGFCASGDNNIPCDLYYSNLDGNFNDDGDTLFGESNDGPNGGEVDLFAEVYVGRACVDSLQEVSNFVNKTLRYESTNSSYLEKVLMVGEDLGFGGIAEYGGNCMDEMINGSSAHGYSTAGYPANYTVSTLYDRDWEPNHNWPKSQIKSIINSGVHFINHLGHCNVLYALKMNVADVDGFYNTDNCFVISQGCYAGSFDNRATSSSSYYSTDCMAEQFTTEASGAFAVIMNSRYGYGAGGSTDGASQRFSRQFVDALYGENIKNIGRANHDCKEDNIGTINQGVMRYVHYEITLFGDPEMSIREPPRPDHDLWMRDIVGPVDSEYLIKDVNCNTTVDVEGTVVNRGTFTETNVLVELRANNLVVNSTNISSIPGGGMFAVSMGWRPSVAGNYNVKLRVVAVPNESDPNNNERSFDIQILPIPAIQVSPTSISESIILNTTTVRNLVVANNGQAASGDLHYRVLTMDDDVFDPFSTATLDPTLWVSTLGSPVINDLALNEPSGSYALDLDGSGDTVTSKYFDLSDCSGGSISFYYELGGGGESPDSNDHCYLEYNSTTTLGWIPLWHQVGYTTNNDTFDYFWVDLPPEAFTDTFHIRFRSTGSGAGWDDFFIDDIALNLSWSNGDWLKVDDTGGTLSQQQSSLVNVTFDAQDLELGYHNTTITVASNDMDHNPIYREVSLFVTVGPLVHIWISNTTWQGSADEEPTFFAIGYDAYGNEVDFQQKWESSDPWGSVDDGAYHPGKVGTWTVWCNNSDDTLTNSTQVTVTVGEHAQIGMTPTLWSGSADESCQFTAEGTDSDGNPVGPFTAKWETNDPFGSISSSGLYSAGKLGKWSVWCNTTDDSVSGEATVNISGPGPVLGMYLSPPECYMTADDTQQFNAMGLDSDGNHFMINANWFATGGVISPSGLFDATTVGNWSVMATNGTFYDSACVNISAGVISGILVSPALHTMTAGDTDVFTASGCDSDGNPIPIIPAWEVSGGGSINGAGLFSATTVGTHTVYANVSGVSGEALVQVNPADIISIELTPSIHTMTADEVKLFSAVGQDIFGNPVQIFPTWEISGGGTIDQSGLFTALNVGTHKVYANTTTLTSEATVIVIPGSLSRIMITPDNVEVNAGNDQMFTAQGLDSNDNPVDVDVNWQVSGGGSIGGTGLYQATTIGVWTIFAMSGSVTGYATATVMAGVLSAIEVSPSQVNMTVDHKAQFHAAGADQFGNYLGISPMWSVSGGGTIDGNGLFSPSGTGTWTVKAEVGGIFGDAIVNVAQGNVFRVDVTPRFTRAVAGDAIQFSATCYDAYGNPLEGSVTWKSSNGGVMDTSGMFTAHVPGNWSIIASSGTCQGLAFAEVWAGPLDHMTIAPGDVVMTTDDVAHFSALGYDAYNNQVAMQPQWSVDGGGTIFNGLFQPTTVGEWTIMAECCNLSCTASVKVLAGDLVGIEIVPSNWTLGVGEKKSFTASGMDSEGNPIALGVNWSTSGGGAMDIDGTFTGEETGLWSIYATARGHTGVSQVTVTFGAPVRIEVEPAECTIGAGEVELFNAKVFDSHDNPVKVEVEWHVNGEGSITSEGSYRTCSIGEWEVVASYGGVEGVSQVKVVESPLVSISVEAKKTVIEPGEKLRLWAIGQDACGSNSTITPTWSVSEGPSGWVITKDGVFSSLEPGDHVITASVGDVSGSQVITVMWSDMDSDGMPDWWEMEHGLEMESPDDADEDPDGDGASNLDEYLMGTDPKGDGIGGGDSDKGGEGENLLISILIFLLILIIVVLVVALVIQRSNARGKPGEYESRDDISSEDDPYQEPGVHGEVERMEMEDMYGLTVGPQLPPRAKPIPEAKPVLKAKEHRSKRKGKKKGSTKGWKEVEEERGPQDVEWEDERGMDDDVFDLTDTDDLLEWDE